MLSDCGKKDLQYNNLITYRVIPDHEPELARYIDNQVFIRITHQTD